MIHRPIRRTSDIPLENQEWSARSNRYNPSNLVKWRHAVLQIVLGLYRVNLPIAFKPYPVRLSHTHCVQP